MYLFCSCATSALSRLIKQACALAGRMAYICAADSHSLMQCVDIKMTLAQDCNWLLTLCSNPNADARRRVQWDPSIKEDEEADETQEAGGSGRGSAPPSSGAGPSSRADGPDEAGPSSRVEAVRQGLPDTSGDGALAQQLAAESSDAVRPIPQQRHAICSCCRPTIFRGDRPTVSRASVKEAS